MYGMSIFLLGTEKEQMRFCFSVYDLTGKGIIAKEEMANLLRRCLKLQTQEEEGEDGVKVCKRNVYQRTTSKLVFRILSISPSRRWIWIKMGEYVTMIMKRQ